MCPLKSKVGKNPRRGIDVKNKSGISRVPLSKSDLQAIRRRRVLKELQKK
jgi:hypothetical protein